MRIGTYNVLGLTGYPREEAEKTIGDRLSQDATNHFIKVFQELNCDILGLQEGVTFPKIQRIAVGMGMNLATFPSPVAWPGHLITKFPILESRTFSHTTPHAADLPLSRCAGAVLLDPDNHTLMWVMVIHLHPSREELRDLEAEILQNHIKKMLDDTDQFIIMGDFNCEVHEQIHTYLKELKFSNVMEEVGGGVQWTMDTIGIKQHKIDHIYVSQPLISRLVNARVVRDEGFRNDGPQVDGLWVHSDHLPVTANLK